eukprot:scaffold213602_cov32-Tisochrysis_lutea.AAC.2
MAASRDAGLFRAYVMMQRMAKWQKKPTTLNANFLAQCGDFTTSGPYSHCDQPRSSWILEGVR